MDETEVKESFMRRVTHALDYIAANAEQQKRIATALESVTEQLIRINDQLAQLVDVGYSAGGTNHDGK